MDDRGCRKGRGIVVAEALQNKVLLGWRWEWWASDGQAAFVVIPCRRPSESWRRFSTAEWLVIHLDFGPVDDLPACGKSKMDPSFRWDDGKKPVLQAFQLPIPA